MSSIYKCQIEEEDQEVLEVLRDRIAEVAGVTLTGNRLTVRWYQNDELVDVHMIIERVTTPQEAKIQRAIDKRIQKAWDADKDLEADLYVIENGHSPQ